MMPSSTGRHGSASAGGAAVAAVEEGLRAVVDGTQEMAPVQPGQPLLINRSTIHSPPTTNILLKGP